jgi:hypothetical protein
MGAAPCRSSLRANERQRGFPPIVIFQSLLQVRRNADIALPSREAGWWARQDSNLRQHRYERAEKVRTTAQNLAFHCELLNLAPSKFNRLCPGACRLRAAIGRDLDQATQRTGEP